MKLLGAEAEGVGLVAVEDVAGVDFVAHIVERWIVAVGYDSLTLLLESCKVIHYPTAEEGRTVG